MPRTPIDWVGVSLRVAFVHDWLVTYRGGEKVLDALLPLYPSAPIYTLFYNKRSMPRSINQKTIITPKGSHLLRPMRKGLLPWLPSMIESFDLRAFDLIISTSSSVAKGAMKGPRAKHLCYIHSPMRYVWDQMEEYIEGVKSIPFAEHLIRYYAPKMRHWDVESSERVDRFIANSHFVKERVQKFYGRDAGVINPPIDVEKFRRLAKVSNNPKMVAKNYFLAAGALVPYKRFDVAIAACERAGQDLVIAGGGPMTGQLQRAAGKHTRFVFNPTDEVLAELMSGAKALLFPGVEDFGMIAIEAMACGTPVIALHAGGALDFIREGLSGQFFGKNSGDTRDNIEQLSRVLTDFRPEEFDASRLQKWAETFGYEVFLAKIKAEISSLV